MSTPKSLLDDGNLGGALEQLTKEVRSDPTNLQLRTSLFELLSLTGEWDRAEKQIQATAQEGNPQSQIAAGVYRANLQAERDRAQVFAGKARPQLLRPAPEYVELHLSALQRIGEGKLEEARALLDRAEEERPALPGKAGERAFEDFRDYDDRTGGVLEMVVKGKYTWLPLEQLRRIEITPPKKLRDLIWPGARVEADDGTSADVFLFGLYAGTPAYPEDRVRLGRMTEWKALSADLQVGAGLRCFLLDEHDAAIFELKEIEFDARVEPTN